MRFGLTQKVLTFGLALTASFPLLMSGEIGAGFVVTFLLLFVAGWLVSPSIAENHVFRRSVTAITAAVMGVQIIRLIAGTPMAMLGMEFITFLLGAKLISRARAADDNQIVILSFLHIIAATVAMTDLVYGVSFILFVALSSPMLALSYLRQEIEHRFVSKSRRVGDEEMVKRLFNSKRIVSLKFLLGSALLTLPILLITALLFLLFPRIGLGFMGRITDTKATAGFGKEVVLGDMDIVRLEETVMIRLFPKDGPSPPPPRIDLRLRGAVFDRFDGKRWQKTIDAKWMEMPGDTATYYIEATPRAPAEGRFDVLLEAMDPKLLFVPEGTGRIHLDRVANRVGINQRKLRANLYGELTYDDIAGVGIQYSVDITGAPPIGAPPVARLDYKSLFPGSGRFETLAKSLAGEGTDNAKAARLVRALKTDYRYAFKLSGDKKNSAESTPLDRFLFSRKTGTCEHFATALTLMLRAVGIPARLVTGFSGADWNVIGEFYSVRKRSAHSWTEAFINGRWTTLDATPASGELGALRRPSTLTLFVDTLRMRWQRHVVSYDLTTQGKLAFALWRRLKRNDTMSGLPVSTVSWRPLLPVLLLITFVTVAVFLMVKRRRSAGSRLPGGPTPLKRPQKEASSLLKTLDAKLQDLGYPRSPETTPLEHLSRIEPEIDFSLRTAHIALERYNEVRFGRIDFKPGELKVLISRVKHLGKGSS